MKSRIKKIMLIAAALLFVSSGVALPRTGMIGITNQAGKPTVMIK